MKRNGSEIFSLRCKKKCFFRLFCIDAKRRNLKRNENGTKRKQNEKSKKLPSFLLRSKMKRKGSKKLPSFSLRSEMKQNGSEKLPSFSLRSEMEANFFRFHTKKWNEAKTKRKRSENFNAKKGKSEILGQFVKNQRKIWSLVFYFFMSIPSMVKRSEKTFILFRFEAKRKIFVSETKRKKALFISLWSEAKNSKRKKAKRSEIKICFFTWACETHAKRISFRFEAKNFFLRNRLTLIWRHHNLS
jgi:hypothetical protein